MEKYIIKNQDSFNLEHIFECGQCFRWNKQPNGSYIGVIKGAIVQVSKNNNKIIFNGASRDNNFKELIREYFDLDVNYNTYKNILSRSR